MSGRRLLILCYFYPPLAGGGVHRVLGFTRHLPAHGWSTTVVCAGGEDYWVTDPSLETPPEPSAEVIRVGGGSALAAWLRLRGGRGRRRGSTFGALRRWSDWWLLPDSYAGWARRARSVAARRAARGGIDAILSSSPPDSAHLAARDLKRSSRLPWVADFRDPWVGLHFREPPTGWHRARQARMEREVLEGADLTLTASRTHAEEIGRRSGATPRRVLHLPNGFEAPSPSAAPASPAEAGDPDHWTLAFTGTLSQMPDTEVLLEALHDLLARRPEARRRIRARLAGPFDLGYRDRAVALGLAGIVEFQGPLPHAESRALQRRADLLLVWKPRGEGYRTMVPGKLYEYLDAGRPLVALMQDADEAADLVRRAGGSVLPPGDRVALAAHLEASYLAWKEAGRAPSQRAGWLGEYTRERLAARLAGELDAMTGGPR